MRPTQLMINSSIHNNYHFNSQSTNSLSLFKSNNQVNHHQRSGSPSLSPEINMMLNLHKNDEKSIDMVKIDEIHRAVTLGNLRNVQQLIDRKRLAFCRDQMGATPLHKAVIYGQKEIIEYFLDRFPSTIHTRDNRGRTPLHYAAVLPESADLYRMLAEAGADEKALDMFGKKPEDYLNHQDGVSVVVLRESAIVSRPLGQRRSRKSASRMIDPQSWSKIHSSRSLMHRSNIRELIKQGNITTLEEIVIQGYGDRLVGETSSAPLVQEFLKNVPPLIDQINELHKAAQRGNLNDLRSLLDRKGIVFARDQIGCTPLHKAVLYGQSEVAAFLSNEYPSTLDARDHDGRTALHYAAGLDDDRVIYNILIKNGASPNLPDYKGRSAEYYLRFPDQINLQQLMKRSQRLNANYAINTANRIKSKSPCRRRGLSPDSRKPEIHLSGYKSDTGLSDHETGDADGGSSSGSVGDVSHSLLTKANLRSKPGSSLNFSSPAILREEVTSANLRKWIQELDYNSLEGAILEGHGDRVKSKVEMYDQAKESLDIQNYIKETLPKVMNKIRKIHAAVSCGDLTKLQDHLDKNDYALAKDHLGMAPLHKAVILGHIDVVQFILDRFPETVNARDREGRTPLHYAAATTHKNGQKIYKMLLRSGADQRARDSAGKTAEYYRVHLIPLPSELSRLGAHFKRKSGDGHHQASSPLHKRRGILLPSIREKISAALHESDAATLLELTLDGYGDLLLGRASWGEEARKFLKGLPHLLDSIKTLHASIINGELDNVKRILEADPSLIKAKDENGLMAIHLAVSRDQQEIVDYLLEEFSSCLLLKDQFGRTGLHIAAQNKQQDIYKKLMDAGGDPMMIDLRGRTADHYLKLQAVGDAYYNKLFSPSTVTNVETASSPSKRNNISTTVEAKNSSNNNPSGEKIVTNEPESGKGVETKGDGDVKTGGGETSEINDEESEDKTDQELTTEEQKSEPEPEENGDQNNIENEGNKERKVTDSDTSVTNQSTEKENESPDQEENISKEDDKETKETSGNSGDDQIIVIDGTAGENPVEPGMVEVQVLAESESKFTDDENTGPVKSSEDPQPEANENAEATTQDAESKDEVDYNDQPTEKIEEKNDLKDDVDKSVDLDEEKLANNRQDAVVDEKTFTKAKKTSNTKGGVKKIPSLKKTPPLSSESDRVTGENNKKMKGNRKATLPSVVSNRNNSKDRLEKKKSINTRNISTLGPKGIAKNDLLMSKDDADDKIKEKTDSTDPANEESIIDEPDGDKIGIEKKDEEIGETITEDNLEKNQENNDHTEDTNQLEVKDENLEFKDEKSSDEDINQVIVVNEVNDSPTVINDDKESADIKEDIITSKGETGQIEPKDLNVEVERQAKEIAQELVETSIQEAETKINLNGGDGVENVQEASELFNEEEKEGDRKDNDGTDSGTLFEAAINGMDEKDEDQETIINDKQKDIPESKESKPQSPADGKDEENFDKKSSDQNIQSSKLDESNAPESSQDNDTMPSNVDFNNTNNESTVDETKPEPKIHESGKDDSNNTQSAENITENRQESSIEQPMGDKQELNENKDDQNNQDRESEENKANNEVTTELNETENHYNVESNQNETLSDQLDTNVTNEDQVNDSVDINNNISGTTSNQPTPPSVPLSESGKMKPNSGESTSSRLLSGSSPVSNNANSNVDMLNDLIETWLKDGDLLRLEHVVIAGQGERLIGKKSPKETVQEFLDLVPAYMAKIRNVHETVVRGNFNEVRSILTRKRFALSRDHVGASPLHLAVLHGHMDVLVYIITQFPETLDGPDNEGRTPLHYAAVMASKDRQYYDILKKAGANPSLIDKLGHTADFYLEHPDELTIGDLLSNYKHKTESASKRKEPGSVDVWQRPPTADIESRLTPSPSDSQLEEDEGPTHHEIAADVHVDANEKPSQPVPIPTTGGVANTANGNISPGGSGIEEEDVKKEVETISVQFKETLKEEKNKLQESIRRIMGSVPSQPPESLSSGEESSDEKKSEDTVSEYELCQVKDEHGRTVLHLVSSKPQKKAILYQMLASAEYLIPERDEKYRTIRDVAVDAALKDNVQVIDNYILDAFVRRNVGFVQRLSHEGYDLTNVVDDEGHDVTSVLRKRKITSMINLLQDITYFQKSREELHTFIKNDYIQGVLGLVDSDATLVTAKNRRGRTALHIAILFGNLDIISSLINANPGAANVQDNLGRTPLHYAMATSKVEHIGKMLIKAGANRQIRDVKMRTPSYYFVYNDDIRAIRSEEKTLL